LTKNSEVLLRNNVTVLGTGPKVMMFSHGFGCDQHMWRMVAPAFEDTHKVILFDHVGCGNSDLTAYSIEKYSSLQGYAADVVEILDELSVSEVTFVGHSVSSMIGVLAAAERPDLFSSIVMVAPSARYIDDDDYQGGFQREEIEQLLQFLDENHMGWSVAMAPTIMGNPDRAELADELTNSFCKTDPEIARRFARVTFLSDNRRDLSRITAIPSLVLQCSSDVIAPESVGRYIHQQLPSSRLVVMNATGHCPNLSAPEETIEAIRDFVGG
jgi:sigma-B regulation protein RsbQ